MLEVDQISEGIAILILAVVGFSLEKFAGIDAWLSSVPNRVTRAVFLYIVGLIVCERKATSARIAGKLGFSSHDTLNKALARCKPMIGTMAIVLMNFCLSQTNGHLIVDDFLIPKRYAASIQGVYNEFDHADNERVKGMRIVMILWSNGSVRIPVAWAVWHKERKTFLGRTAGGQARYEHTGLCLLRIGGRDVPYRTKNRIARELLDGVLSRGLRVEYVTFDSWYANCSNLAFATANPSRPRLECYSRLKGNRTILYQGRTTTVQALDALFPPSAFNHRHGARIKAVDVFLPGYGSAKLLLVRKDTHAEPERTKYMFSTDTGDTASRILLRYRSRWAIETLFRDLKQELNVGSCQAISLDAQESHIALSIFAFVLLELLPELEFRGTACRTVGEKKKLLSKLSLFTDTPRKRRWIIDTALPGKNSVLVQESKADGVYFKFDFAYRILLFPAFQRSA